MAASGTFSRWLKNEEFINFSVKSYREAEPNLGLCFNMTYNSKETLLQEMCIRLLQGKPWMRR